MTDLSRKLSPHFTLGELAKCGDWDRWSAQQIAGLSSKPGGRGGALTTVADRLELLAQTILEPIRVHVGRPIKVNSGYRSPAKNSATPGASKTSQHVYGEAADICVPGWTDAQLRTLWEWVGWTSKLKIGQVIFEDARPGSEGGAWLHVSLGAPFRAPSRCGQRLTWTPGEGYRLWEMP